MQEPTKNIVTENAEWTILSLINWGTEYFASKGIESGRLNIELLICHTLSYSRVQLYTHFDRPVSKGELAALKHLVQRRVTREPVQYILGTTNFMGIELRVDKRVLIPRPETELLVEEIILDSARSAAGTLLDIGTGSGNIAIAVASRIQDLMIDAVDVSADALTLAGENVKAQNLAGRIQLLEGNVLAAGWKPPRATYDVIVSNPPYISSSEFELVEPEIRHFEPVIATTDNGDGLSFYRRISELARDFLVDEGKVYVEIAYNQLDQVSEIFRRQEFKAVRHRQDFAGIPRCVIASKG